MRLYVYSSGRGGWFVCCGATFLTSAGRNGAPERDPALQPRSTLGIGADSVIEFEDLGVRYRRGVGCFELKCDARTRAHTHTHRHTNLEKQATTLKVRMSAVK